MSSDDVVVVTGMAANTMLGDDLATLARNMYAGRSGVGTWKNMDPAHCRSKIGGDLSEYDISAKLTRLETRLPEEVLMRAKRLLRRVPWSTRLSILLALDACLDASLLGEGADLRRLAVIVAGHNIGYNYQYTNTLSYQVEPEYIDRMYSLYALDSDHGGCVSEVLGAKGPTITVGGACASGNMALRQAVMEIALGAAEIVLVVSPVVDCAPAELHGLALMGALITDRYQGEPERASRPFDLSRGGCVPAHGGAALVVESARSSKKRGVAPYAEVAGVVANSQGCQGTGAELDARAAVMRQALEAARVAPREVDFISAHATSTRLGDLSEAKAIEAVFGLAAAKVRVNAPKSLLGHTAWSAATVEAVMAIIQMQDGRLHPSINIDQQDPDIRLNLCLGTALELPIRHVVKNSFGCGGINCVAVFRRPEQTRARIS